MVSKFKLNITFWLQLHTVRVHNASRDSKTAEELLKQMLLAINIIETEWGSTVIACTMDASGELQKAQCLLQETFPYLVVLDCLAHQWNLIIGDLFKVKDDYGEYGDMAQELITLLEVRPALELLIMKHKTTLLASGKRVAHEKMETAIATIRDATFWHAMARWKNLLEPITLMTNIHQAAHAQPEHIVILFGFPVFQA
ncbi:hypothetical protein BS17DRAFT_853447 [Gyrodon lividus]|nr:hypothetical protein BS17DRAFT_853447 [Gyrodon lividus]